jgi:PAS domain S-box-containing protein
VVLKERDPSGYKKTGKRISKSPERKKTEQALKGKLISWHNSVEVDEYVKTVGMFRPGEDITERKKVEEALCESQEFNNILLDNAPNQVVVINPDTSIEYVNPSWEELNGWTKDEVIGQKIPYPWWTKEQRSESFATLFKEVLAGENGKGELISRKRNGELYWIAMNWTPVKKDGQLQYLLVNSIDITERKRAEGALQESEEKYRNLIENSKDSICVVDLKGNIQFANKASVQLTGYSLDEAVGMNLRDMVPLKYWPMALTKLREARKGKSVPYFETAIKRKDGTIVPVEAGGQAILKEGEAVGIQIIVRDITERKRLELEYKTIIQTTLDGFWLADMQGRFLDVNDAYCQLIGYNRDELLKMSIPDIEAVEKPRETAARIARIREVGGDRFETHHRCKDGRIIDVEISVNYVEVGGGRMVVFIRDITERKMAEKGLQESEEKFRNLFEYAKDAVLLADADTGVLVDVNPAGCNMLGLLKDKIIGRHQTAIHPPEMAEKFQEIFRDHVRKGIVSSNDTIIQRADGTRIPASVSASVIKLADKTIIQGVFRDVSERKQAEEKLRQSEEFSSSLLKNAPNPISVINPDTSIGYVNPSFEKLTGFTSAEVIGIKAPYPWWPEESREKFESLLMEDLKGRSSITEKQLQKKNGEHFWVEIKVTSVKHNGATAYLLLNWVDLTERKKMEEQLIMQDRLASIGQLSAGMAHELNNPLTSVINFSTLLLRRELPNDIKEDLKTINDEAQRIAKIVKNLVIFARRQPQEKQPMNINEGIQKVLELRAYEQKVNNIQVNVRLGPNLPQILGNSSQLQQVFLNIIINAEFLMLEAHGKGILTVTTEKVGNFVRASFADDGPGISRENMRRLFTPFFTTKEVGKGTGLGLSTCHGIITEHGGRIRAESELGKGAIFILELPMYNGPVQERENNRENQLSR